MKQNKGWAETVFRSWLQLALLLVGLLDAQADPLENWTPALPSAIGPFGSKVVYGNGVFVTAGYGGIRISTDATNWASIPAPGNPAINSVAFGDGRFALAGSGGTVLTSTNGISWAAHHIGTNANLTTVAVGGGRIVVRGIDYSGASEDGETWSRGQSIPDYIEELAYGNGVFVAATSLGGAALSTSQDGLHWSASPAGIYFDHSGARVAFGNGRFVALSRYARYHSVDGYEWIHDETYRGSDFSLSLCFGNGVFVSAESSFNKPVVTISEDGIHWSIKGAGPKGLSFGNGLFFSLLAGGTYQISSDAEHWGALQYSPPTFKAICFDGSAFVAVGSRSATSTNGVNWKFGTSSVTSTVLTHYSLLSGNGIYLNSGSFGASVSSDGLHWLNLPQETISPSGQMAYGQGWFVVHHSTAISDSRIKRSMDGTNWQPGIELLGGGIYHVAFGNNRFVAVGVPGMALVSSDSFRWTTNIVDVDVQFAGVSYANGLFIAGATPNSGGVLTSYTSPDGSIWTRHPPGPDGAPSGKGIVFCNGVFVSPVDSDNRSPFLTSEDGFHWTGAQSPYPGSIASIATDGSVAIGIGTAGSLMRSEPFVPKAPAIGAQPRDQTFVPGYAVMLDVLAHGSRRLAYQWFKDGTAIDGGTNQQLLLANPNHTDAGSYVVVVRNDHGSVTSSVASLTVSPDAVSPQIIAQPSSQTVAIGDLAFLTVRGTGAQPLSHQWRRNGEPILGATNAYLVFQVLSETNAGGFTVTLSNAHDSVTSSAAALTVTVPARPLILSQPVSLIITNGDSATFDVTAAGIPSLRYQWYRDSSPIINATNETLVLTNNIHLGMRSFSVRVSNASGEIESQQVTLSVYGPPSPAIFTGSQDIAIGAPAEFKSYAGGYPLPAVQWLKNGQAIPLETNVTFSIPSVQATDAGNYSVAHSNLFGSVRSAAEPLTVFPKSPLDYWTNVTLLPSISVAETMVQLAGTYLILGQNGLSTSPDGKNWVGHDLPDDRVTQYNAAAYGDSRFVAVGVVGRAIAFTYPGNENTWSRTITTSSGFSGVAFGSGTFVAAGNSSVYTSINGEDWITATNLTLKNLVYGAERFVALQGYALMSSVDGKTWTECAVESGDLPQANSVAFGNGRFLAAGFADGVTQRVFLTSLDGQTWRVVSRHHFNGLDQLLFGGGVFLGLGSELHTSLDGKRWVRRNPWTDSSAGGSGVSKGLHFLDNLFILRRYSNDGENRYSSNPMLELALAAGNLSDVIVRGMPGTRCQILSSPALNANAAWSPVGVIDLETYPMIWTDPAPPSSSGKFYRAETISAE